MNQTIEGAFDSVSAIDSSKETIHLLLKEGISEILSGKSGFRNSPDIPIEESCFVLESWVSKDVRYIIN